MTAGQACPDGMEINAIIPGKTGSGHQPGQVFAQDRGEGGSRRFPVDRTQEQVEGRQDSQASWKVTPSQEADIQKSL